MVGNTLADLVAKDGAKLHSHSEQALGEHTARLALARQVHRRTQAILVHLGQGRARAGGTARHHTRENDDSSKPSQDTAWGRWAKKAGIGRSHYPSGLCVWVSEFGQSIVREEAYASAYAHALRDARMEVIFTGLKQSAATVAATAGQ